jgi:hypothetical protein
VNFLELKNPHERDARIHFDEPTHTYRVDNQIVGISVSGLVHAAFPQFDANSVVENSYNSWASEKRSPYFRLIHHMRILMHMDDHAIKREIINQWQSIGTERASAGTSVHLSAEMFLNNAPREDKSPEFQQFSNWYNKDKPKTWEPYRTEWSVFHEDADLAGQIDGLFYDPIDKSYHMVDWKCVEKLEAHNSFGERGFKPFQKLPNTNLNHYYVQQNLYAWILREKYGIDVKSMSLLKIHHTNDMDTAVLYKVHDLRKEVDEYMHERIQVVAASCVHTSKKRKAWTTEEIESNEHKIKYYKELIASLEEENSRARRYAADESNP